MSFPRKRESRLVFRHCEESQRRSNLIKTATLLFCVGFLFLGLAGQASAATYTACSSGCNYTTIQGVFNGVDLSPGDTIQAQADTVGGTVSFGEAITIGTNDYGLNKWNATDFGIAYAATLDALHSALPSAKIICQTPLVHISEVANGTGSTLGDHRTQIATVCNARSWTTLVDGTQILTTSDLTGDVHPSTSGHAKYALAINNILTITPTLNTSVASSLASSAAILNGSISATGSTTPTVDSFPNATSGSSGYYFSRSGANSDWIQTNSWQDTISYTGTNQPTKIIPQTQTQTQIEIQTQIAQIRQQLISLIIQLIQMLTLQVEQMRR